MNKLSLGLTILQVGAEFVKHSREARVAKYRAIINQGPNVEEPKVKTNNVVELFQ